MAIILPLLASALPEGACSGLTGYAKDIPGVVNYETVPVSAVPQGGNAVQGLVVSLGTATQTVRISESVALTVAIANVSSTPRLLWEPMAPCSYTFSVTGASTGKTNIVRPLECIGDIYSLPAEELSPGMATLFTFKLASSELVSVPDRYTISVRNIKCYTDNTIRKFETLVIASNPISVVVTR